MKRGWIGAAALLAGLIVLPHYLDSCSYTPGALRFTTYHNMLPGDVAAGRLGVIRPHFRRRELLLAYRGLSGLSFAAEPLPDSLPSGDLAAPWLEARKLVSGAPATGPVQNEKAVPGADYQFYTNCLADSFSMAAATVKKRVAQWGAQSRQAAEWLRGQDQVFQNCGSGPVIPQALTAGDPLLAADREYQIAAAEFYAGQYDKARADFDRIAANAGSPWHEAARYVAARAFIRQATLGANQAKLLDAAARLDAIVKDPGAGQWHAPAAALLAFVRAMTDRRQRLVELGNELMQPGPPAKLDRVLTDYTWIWDRMEAGKFPAESDVAKWIGTFQSGAQAADTWRTKKSLPWLIAALQEAKAATPELVAAARAVKPESPAWDSVTYYGILAEIRGGQADAARAWADEALAAKATFSTTNLLRSERLRLARDWSEFLRFAVRRPVTDFSEEDEVEEPIPNAEAKLHPSALDADGSTALNERVPLALWLDAAQSSAVPAVVQADIAQAGWVRAVILGNAESARMLAERIQKLKPALAAEMRAWLAEKDPATAQFAAVFLMLRAPGLEPLVRSGGGRLTPVMQSDSFRDNWWMLGGTSGGSDTNHEALNDLYPGAFGPTEFLPAAQRSAGAKEWGQLMDKAQNSVNYLCAQTLAWAHAHPQDPRVPQALHVAVQATHYGPSDQSSKYSHEAFDLLHKVYPNSDWTKKTKYWY